MKKWRKQMDILKLKIISKKNYNKLIDELEKLKEKISSKQKSIRKLQEELRNFKDFYNIPYEEDFIKYKGKTKKIPIGSNFKKYRIKKVRKKKRRTYKGDL
jgi:hypothetical protein